MGHQEALDALEAGLDVFPQGLKLGMLFVGHHEALLQDAIAAGQAVVILIWVAPIPDEEHEPLERGLPGVLDGQAAIFGEQLQMLQIVFLDVRRQIVD